MLGSKYSEGSSAGFLAHPQESDGVHGVLLPMIAPVDAIYATSVLSTTRMLGTHFFARSDGHNKPLILLSYEVEPLQADSWTRIYGRMLTYTKTRRARLGRPLPIWIEGETLAMQALSRMVNARMIPLHLTRDEMWHPICQSVSAILSQGMVGYTSEAAALMDDRPFLNAAGVYAGPKTDDPTIAAFLYGVVLGLDEVLAKDPHAKMPVRTAR